MISSMPGVEIINACRLLFPAEVIVNPGFLNTIDDDDLKTAFRKKALKTHPDRSIALGCSQEELSRKFQEVSSAYKTLQAYFLQRPLHGPQSQTRQWTWRPYYSMKTARPTPKDFFYKGALPQRELRLGEYLYYSKKISWRTLIKAIVWQKKQRPLFGQIARDWNFLTDDDIRLILKKKTRDEIFGECARRFGFLSKFQQMAVTGRQRQLQPLFGMHFVEIGFLSVAQIDILVGLNKQHNYRVRYN